MVSKRSGTWDFPPSKKKKSLSDKVEKIQRTLNERKPEMKNFQIGSSGTVTAGSIALVELTNIPQGDTVSTRDGAQVKFHHVKYSCTPSIAASAAAGLDFFILTLKDAVTLPVYADFLSYPGGGGDRRKTIEWVHELTNSNNNGNILGNLNFKYPMKIHYAGTGGTACFRNRTYMVVKNATGSSINYQITAHIFFTDI